MRTTTRIISGRLRTTSSRSRVDNPQTGWAGTNGDNRKRTRRILLTFQGESYEAPRSGRGGRRFKSCHSDQLFKFHSLIDVARRGGRGHRRFLEAPLSDVSETSRPASADLGLVLVTGASGFVGSAVVRTVRQAGYPVRALVRALSPRTNLQDPSVQIAEGD